MGKKKVAAKGGSASAAPAAADDELPGPSKRSKDKRGKVGGCSFPCDRKPRAANALVCRQLCAAIPRPAPPRPQQGKRGAKVHHWQRDGLEAELAALGLRIKEVASDGNCFFRSVADQLQARCWSQRRPSPRRDAALAAGGDASVPATPG